jgi:hypothetical protein
VKLKVEFPALPDNSGKSCVVKMREILKYLRMESPDEHAIKGKDLTFVRTAQVGGDRYWIWTFNEGDGTQCFVTVSVAPEGQTTIGYEQNHDGLTAEQYLLGDYYRLF